MFQQLVANWLRQQAKETLIRNLQPAGGSLADAELHCDVAMIFPSRAEAGGMVDQLSNVHTTRCDGFVEHLGAVGGKTIGLVEATLPHDRLARITRDIAMLRKPRWMLSAGFAVALATHVQTGHVIMARRVLADRGFSLQTGLKLDDAALEGTSAVHAGTLLTVEQLPSSKAAKLSLAQQYDSLACDRQAAVIAEVCRLQQLPMLAVHTVAERLDGASVIAEQVKSQVSLAAKMGAAAGAVIERPSSVKQFWNQKETALRLSDRLASFLVDMLQQLN